MTLRARMYALGAIVAIVSASFACAQTSGLPPAQLKSPLTERELKELLIWNSPWEGNASNSNETISYRTTFVLKRNELVASVLRLSNSERGDSVVSISEGRVNWRDTVGADVSVSVEGVGELVGTATSKTTNYRVIFKPRK